MRHLEGPRDLPSARHALARVAGERGRMIATADMYWVTDDMTRVALDASQDLPEWSPVAVQPSPWGMLYWAGLLPEIHPFPREHPDATLPLAGVLWGREAGRIAVNLLTTAAAAAALGDKLGQRVIVEDTPPLGPLGYFTLPLEGHPVPEDNTVDEAVGITALLGATWTLMQQPTIAERREVRPGRRDVEDVLRLEGSRPLVSAVSLRPMRTVRPGSEDAPSGRHLTVRHVVRGHWRQQYHPSDHSHRPKWIPSYLKGPEGAPLHLTQQVMVWRR